MTAILLNFQGSSRVAIRNLERIDRMNDIDIEPTAEEIARVEAYQQQQAAAKHAAIREADRQRLETFKAHLARLSGQRVTIEVDDLTPETETSAETWEVTFRFEDGWTLDIGRPYESARLELCLSKPEKG